uniref:Uncharacterized protein n=1 Tax=Oryza punctata TaxID=4537 RepID=A0A0E0LQ98_ORYPU
MEGRSEVVMEAAHGDALVEGSSAGLGAWAKRQVDDDMDVVPSEVLTMEAQEGKDGAVDEKIARAIPVIGSTQRRTVTVQATHSGVGGVAASISPFLLLLDSFHR